MQNYTIGFACPACGVQLTVPSAASGVAGPCPSCSTVIRAPLFRVFEAPLLENGGAPRKELEMKREEPLRIGAGGDQGKQEEVQVRVVEPEAKAKDEAPVRLEVIEAPEAQPKPGIVPARQAAPEPQMIDPGVMLSKRRQVVFQRALVGGGVLAALAVGFAIFASTKNHKYLKQTTESTVDDLKEVPIGDRAAPVEEVRQRLDPRANPKIPPPGTDVPALVDECSVVLRGFLGAGNMEARQPMIETATVADELSASVLAKPLPEVARFDSIGMRFNKIEGAADVIFRVDFKTGKNLIDPQLVMVRKRGTQTPKVMADAFLDSYGGRVRDFVATPRDGEQIFHIFLTTYNFCNRPEVPDHQSKQTGKISLIGNGPEVGSAYFGTFSLLPKKLERMGMKYGLIESATVTLRWNQSEDPTKPYIEMIDVQSLDWD